MTEQALHNEDILQARVSALEQENEDVRQKTNMRIVHAEMKVEALRAGMVDLDGLKFLDLTKLDAGDDDSMVAGSELIIQLKRSKPWLFAAPSSSSVARVPAAKPAAPKLAKDMTDEEYRVARAAIIKRSAY